MPAFYLFCAGWGGQDGSLLFWTFLMGLLSALAAIQVKRRMPQLFPAFLLMTAAAQLFFCITTFFAADPFGVLPHPPADGKGLNPLLQTPVMALHPPTLYMGLITFFIPYSLGMAALITNQLGNEWLKAARTWTLISWTFLTLGNLLGAYWAYNELGWGGFWAWDPVENASFLPWLTATAYIHTAMIQERMNMMKVWNMSLLIVTYFLTVFGTFLTRSGLISSVHAFARSDIGEYFVYFLILLLVVSFGLMFWRYGALRGQNELASPYSREASFLLNNALFSIATFIVLLGTTYPLLREWSTGTKATVGPPFFNRAMAPVALGLLLLLGICPLLGWFKVHLGRLVRLLIIPVLSGVAGGVGFSLYYSSVGPGDPDLFTHIASSTIAGLCVFVVAALVAELYEEIRRYQSRGQTGVLRILTKHLKTFRRRYGGYLVHIGVVFLFIGFAGYGFRLEKAAAMTKGEWLDVGGYLVRFLGMEAWADRQKKMYEGHLELFKPERIQDEVIKEGQRIELEGGKASLELKRRHAGDAKHAAVLIYKPLVGAIREIAPEQPISMERTLYRIDRYEWVQNGKQKEELQARLQGWRPGGSLGRLAPARHKYNKHQEPTTEIALMTRLMDDFYAILVTWEKRPKQATLAHFKFYLNPLIFWLWLGGFLMIIGVIIAAWPKKKATERETAKGV